MKKLWFVLLIWTVACKHQNKVNSYKDLEQHKMDLKIYQENMGDQVKSHNLQEVSWYLEGIDSILILVSDGFDTHHRLKQPFSKAYRREMKEPIQGLRTAIKNADTAAATSYYRVLINNCNDCHLDNDVDKVVKY